jgi:hypothetical protein
LRVRAAWMQRWRELRSSRSMEDARRMVFGFPIRVLYSDDVDTEDAVLGS